MRLRHHCCQLRKKEANAGCGKTFQLIWSYNSSTWHFPFLQTPSVMLSFGFCGSAQSGTLWLNDCNLETLQIKEQGLKCSNCASSLPTQSPTGIVSTVSTPAAHQLFLQDLLIFFFFTYSFFFFTFSVFVLCSHRPPRLFSLVKVVPAAQFISLLQTSREKTC